MKLELNGQNETGSKAEIDGYSCTSWVKAKPVMSAKIRERKKKISLMAYLVNDTIFIEVSLSPRPRQKK